MKKIVILCLMLTNINCSNNIYLNCNEKNYMTSNKVNPENYYENRRELKTTFSKSDFDILYRDYKSSCANILINFFYCNICFGAKENSLTSYNGKKYFFNKKNSCVEITDECIKLISSMQMGSNENTIFLESQ